MRLAEAGFLVLFAGAFFYHAAVGLGLIPPLLGGYFSLTAALLAVLLLPAGLKEWARDRRSLTWMDLLFGCFFLYFAFVVAFNAAQGADPVIVKSHHAALLGFAAIFLIFRGMELGGARTQAAFTACLAAMSGIVFSHVVDGQFHLRGVGSTEDKGALVTYQSFAFYFLATMIVAVSRAGSFASRLALYALCVPALYFIGARSELAGLLPAIAALELVRSRPSTPRFLAFLAVFGGLFAASSSGLGLLELLPQNRTLELLDPFRTTSWEGREAHLDAGLRTIARHPFLGAYASYDPGYYIHNILSAWVDLGLPGFLLTALVVVLPVLFLAADLLLRPGRAVDQRFVLAAVLGTVTLFLVMTAKQFTYLMVAAAAGAFANYRSGLRRLEEEAP